MDYSTAAASVCPTPGKRRYPSVEVARGAAEAIGRRSPELKDMRPYRCACGSWHLTSNRGGGYDFAPADLVPVDGDEVLLADADDEAFDRVVRRDLEESASVAELLALRHPANLRRWALVLKARWSVSGEHLEKIAGLRSGESRAWRERIHGFRVIAQQRRAEAERREHEFAHAARPRDPAEERARLAELGRLAEAYPQEYRALYRELRKGPGPDGRDRRAVAVRWGSGADPAVCPTPEAEGFAHRAVAAADAAIVRRPGSAAAGRRPHLCVCGRWHLLRDPAGPEGGEVDGLVPGEGDERLLAQADLEQFAAVVQDDLAGGASWAEASSLRHPANLPRWEEALKGLRAESERKLQHQKPDRSERAAATRVRLMEVLDLLRVRLAEQDRRWRAHREAAMLLDTPSAHLKHQVLLQLSAAHPEAAAQPRAAAHPEAAARPEAVDRTRAAD